MCSVGLHLNSLQPNHCQNHQDRCPALGELQGRIYFRCCSLSGLSVGGRPGGLGPAGVRLEKGQVEQEDLLMYFS